MRFNVASHHVADDDATRLAVDDDEFEHFMPCVHLNRAYGNLSYKCLIGAQQQLLAGLAARVERACALHSAEGAVIEQTAVFASERHALGDALVNDLHADLGESIEVGLAQISVE